MNDVVVNLSLALQVGVDDSASGGRAVRKALVETRHALLLQRLHETRRLRRLARPVDALEHNESSSLHLSAKSMKNSARTAMSAVFSPRQTDVTATPSISAQPMGDAIMHAGRGKKTKKKPKMPENDHVLGGLLPLLTYQRTRLCHDTSGKENNHYALCFVMKVCDALSAHRERTELIRDDLSSLLEFPVAVLPAVSAEFLKSETDARKRLQFLAFLYLCKVPPPDAPPAPARASRIGFILKAFGVVFSVVRAMLKMRSQKLQVALTKWALLLYYSIFRITAFIR